jgi:hypothetical protein
VDDVIVLKAAHNLHIAAATYIMYVCDKVGPACLHTVAKLEPTEAA